MGRSGRRFEKNKWSYRACERKKKFKSSEASKIADRYNQRKYECSYCGHWHLTKQKGEPTK